MIELLKWWPGWVILGLIFWIWWQYGEVSVSRKWRDAYMASLDASWEEHRTMMKEHVYGSPHAKED